MDERVDRNDSQVETAPMSRQTRVARRSRLRVGVILILLLGAAAGAGWYLWTHHQGQVAQSTAPGRGGGSGRGAQVPPQPVGAATIDKGDIRIILNELGTVTSLDTVTVLTQISGQLTDVGFQEGQMVKKGDFLAQIDPRPYQAALEQAQGTLAHDQGLLAQAQSDLKRYQTLGRQDSIAQQQLEDQRYLVEQYTGTVQTDQGTVDNAKLNLTYCHIISPIDGQVGLRQVDAGNYIQTTAGSAIVVITKMQPISVLFSVPEDDLPEIIKQVRGGAPLQVEAYDRSNAHLLATGQLATLDNQIDTTTGTLKLRAMFANPDELLYPNQFVNARLLVNTLRSTVRVPVPAVQRGEPGTYVYVINANNTVSVRPVKLGPTDNGYTAVLSGLEPGDKVVTDGTDRLRDGAPVTVPTAQGKGGPAGGAGSGAGAGPGAAAGQGPGGDTAGSQRRPPAPGGDGSAAPIAQGTGAVGSGVRPGTPPQAPAQAEAGPQGPQQHRRSQQPAPQQPQPQQ